MNTTRSCWQNHLGLWAVLPSWFEQAVAHVTARRWDSAEQAAVWARRGDSRRIRSADDGAGADLEAGSAGFDPYGAEVSDSGDGIRTIEVAGPLMKAASKFGGTSTIGVRKALAEAVGTPAVRGIMLRIESPGGSVAGMAELVAAIAAADAAKPVYAHIDDLGASAALWAASQARRITANATAEVGSIGTLGVLYDQSEAAKMAGVRVLVIASGPNKGTGTPGAPILPEQLKPLEAYVRAAADLFVGDVARGRDLEGEALAAVTDGRTWISAEAKRLGLIDEVASFDAAMQSLRERVGAGADRSRVARRARAAVAVARASAASRIAAEAAVRAAERAARAALNVAEPAPGE